MRRFVVICLSASLTLFATGCDFETIVDLYISDLETLVSSAEKRRIDAPAKLQIQTGGRESCEEKKAELAEVLRPYFREMKAPLCEDGELGTNLAIEVKVSIVKSRTDLDQEGYLAALLAERAGDAIRVNAVMNGDSLAGLNRRLEETFYTKIEPRNFKLEIVVHNDAAGPVTVSVRSAYLNGEPHPFQGQVRIERRDRARVQLSTIFVERLFLSRQDEALSIRPAAPVATPQPTEN